MAAGGRVPVRAAGGLVDDRRARARPPVGAARAAADGERRRAPVRAREPPRASWPSTSRSSRHRDRPGSLRRAALRLVPGAGARPAGADRGTARCRAARRARSTAPCWSARRGRCCACSRRGRLATCSSTRSTRNSTAPPPSRCSRRPEADAHLSIMAPLNTRALAGIDPERIVRAARGRAEVQEARLARRWCGTLWPTPALAQQAGMAEDAYAEFVRRALFLDRDDPAGAWRELSDRQATLIGRLARARGDPDRRAGHRSAAARRRPDVDQLRRAAEHAQRRGVHRSARGFGRGDDPLHDPLEPARGGGAGCHAPLCRR